MILVVNMCRPDMRLSWTEFVRPVEQIVSKDCDHKTLHRSDLNADVINRFDKMILCGTALKDHSYLDDRGFLDVLSVADIPVLGICAGIQSICLAYGGELYPWKEIGMRPLTVVSEDRVFGRKGPMEGYHLHSYGVSLPEGFKPLIMEHDKFLAFRHEEKDVYGTLFHPEVRNHWMIENFLHL